MLSVLSPCWNTCFLFAKQFILYVFNIMSPNTTHLPVCPKIKFNRKRGKKKIEIAGNLIKDAVVRHSASCSEPFIHTLLRASVY